MSDSRLNILLDAKNNTNPAFQAARANLVGLNSAAQTVSSGMGGLAAAAGVAGIAVLGRQAIDTAGALAEQATAMRRAEAAALSMAGSQAQLNALLDTYQKVTRGASTEGEALAQLSRLQAIGFADSAEELERFLTAAKGAAAATGQNLDYVIGQLQLAIANQSTMRLDQLGLGVSEVKDKIAELTATNAGMSQEAAYQEAIVGGLVAKYGDLVTSGDAAATGSERLGTTLRQMSEDIASNVGPNVDRLAGEVADLLKAMQEAGRGASEAEATFGAGITETLVATNNRVLDLAGSWQNASAVMKANALGGDTAKTLEADLLLKGMTHDLVAAGEEYNATASIMGAPLLDLGMLQNGIVAFQGVEAAIAATGSTAVIATGQIDDLVRSLNNQTFAQSQANWQKMTDMIASTARQGGLLYAKNQGDEAGLARQKAISAELTAQRGYLRAMGYEGEDLNLLMQAYADNVSEADRELFKATTQTTKLSDAAREAEAAFNEVKGAVSSVLQAALDPGVGVNPDEILEKVFGFRPDAINENARRLADIAKNGLRGQDWLGEFGAQVPDIWRQIRSAANPQEEAAFLLREFQDGLRPELIDKGRAKEIAKRMLTGDQNMAELAQEIAGELAAEMGIAQEKALGAARGAVGLSSSTGAEAGTAFSDGATAAMNEAQSGSAMVDAFVASARAVYGRLRTAGEDAGREFGAGFMTATANVPAEFVALLTSLVLPGVRTGLNTDATLTGTATP